jgi:hypothetical protein
MDWEIISAADILALFSTLCTSDKIVHKVEIYPSLFGLDKMKNDTLLGPPQEIFAEPEKAKLQKKKKEDSSSDEDEIDGERREAYD